MRKDLQEVFVEVPPEVTAAEIVVATGAIVDAEVTIEVPAGAGTEVAIAAVTEVEVGMTVAAVVTIVAEEVSLSSIQSTC
ncbi:hypothetical protein DTL21_23730 [Bremerella cremea]|uniref:Uncharacterized protein n=1 Tax=Blastopirellula marina TaxID=124 RepID=A0A2S8FDX2_9BACT|nr:hypothetical protein C5Y83_23690 [Blastopirellula marina]RCS43723.1 hypothetical protein DTL21_23730 [Bremerella cremea]